MRYLKRIMPIGQIEADVGIEIELEGRLAEMHGDYWGTHVDGSLRDGLEFVSVPLKLATVPTALRELDVHMVNNCRQIKLSHRGSTHIHVNYTQRTWEAAFNSLVIYSLIEPFLFRVCGRGRDGNLFCLPCYDTQDLPDIPKMWFQYLELEAFTNRGRYSALNLASLQKFGTFEYRCFPASNSSKEIQKWIEYVVNIRTHSELLNINDLNQLIGNFYRHPQPLLAVVFGDKDFTPLLGPTGVSALVELGCSRAHEIVNAINAGIAYREGIRDDDEDKKKRRKKIQGLGVERIVIDDVIQIRDVQPNDVFMEEDD